MDDERDLVARAARGEMDAFLSVWTSHRGTIHRFASWMLQDAESADDVTQECFLALLEHPARFDPERGDLRTFLLGIARNKCRLRWRERQPETALDDEAADSTPQALDELVASESRTILNAAISTLPPLQREALFLFEYEDLSLEEAAAVAGTDVGTFKSRLYRGRQRLKRELGWLVKEGF